MAKRDRQDHGFARGKARPAPEFALRLQGRFSETGAGAARGKRPTAPRAKGAPCTAVAATRALAVVAKKRRKAPLDVRLVVTAQGFVGDLPDRLAEAPLEQ